MNHCAASPCRTPVLHVMPVLCCWCLAALPAFPPLLKTNMTDTSNASQLMTATWSYTQENFWIRQHKSEQFIWNIRVKSTVPQMNPGDDYDWIVHLNEKTHALLQCQFPWCWCLWCCRWAWQLLHPKVHQSQSLHSDALLVRSVEPRKRWEIRKRGRGPDSAIPQIAPNHIHYFN